MTLYNVFVPGEPKGQPRPRAFAFHGKARVYDPGTAEHWKSQIALAFPQTIVKYGGPVAVSFTFYMPRPKHHYTKAGVLKDGARISYSRKPDIDNMVKGNCDAMTTIGVWDDDAQVVTLTASKWYTTTSNPRSGCHIIVETAP